MYNILICDDEPDIVSALKIYLTADDYRLFTTSNGADAVRINSENEIHLILMDIMMPVMDGITAMQRIRQTHNTPIILLTAKGEDIDKILGLNSGADDYVTKPFNPVELQARVKSQLRRYLQLGAGNGSGRQLVIGGIVLDDGSKSVTLDGEAISLTPTEYEILRLFMQNPGRVFSPTEIYSKVWREQPCGAEKTIAVHIRHLREKIEINPAQPRYLLVVWGQGYKIVR
jgi:DNA-binding response OmpR family regulator